MGIERSRRWFEKYLDNDKAEQFIDELHKFTEEFVVNYAREVIPVWPLTNVLSRTYFSFDPQGVIVHSSDTPSIWNALHMCTRHVYGTHFIILSGRRMPMQANYELLSEIPATMLMLYPLDALVPHAGYISSKTWGIDLRNAGRLRPVEKGFDPTPIMPSEETDQNFITKPRTWYDMYWRQKLWCYPFDGPVGRWEDYCYEAPTKNQIIALIAMLRVLYILSDRKLDRRMIVPSNCINGGRHVLPFLVWRAIRDNMTTIDPISEDYEWINHLSTNQCEFEAYDIEDEDESMVGEQLEQMRWRGERDDGQLALLFSKRHFELGGGYRKSLRYYGYDTTDLDFSMHMWALSRGLLDARDEEIYNKMNRESPLFPGAY